MPEKIEVILKWSYTPDPANYPDGASIQEMLEVDQELVEDDLAAFLEMIPDEIDIDFRIRSW